MAKLDIRGLDEDEVITEIVFADSMDQLDENARSDTVCEINISDLHPEYIFIEAVPNGEYLAIRKADVSNLITALQKAKAIWEGVE